ncbi:MAG: SGNH/GDSL hydrolase family protein [Planctomycetaceae bacterium]
MQRVILLGASNVTLGFPMLVEGLRASLPGPVELFAAHGHGRSYGLRSRVLMRRLPGILNCGLWDALPRASSDGGRPLALITDVGNDLLFGVRPELLLSWVEQCVQRLGEQHAAVTIALPPLQSTLRLSAARYHATRMVFFPGSGPDWESMRRMIVELESGLRELAAQYTCRAVEPRAEWYGFDPIHVRSRHRPASWSEILSAWPVTNGVRIARRPAAQGLRYWRLAPAERDLWGRTRRNFQPAWRDGDAASIWLY